MEDSIMRSEIKEALTEDSAGNKIIHNAVLKNDLNTLNYQINVLNNHNVSLDIRNKDQYSALQLAVVSSSKNNTILTLLSNATNSLVRDSIGNNLLHLAAWNSNSEDIVNILKKFMTDFETEIDRMNDDGLTPLMVATIQNKLPMVKSLLEKKANPNIQDKKYGKTALFYAVENEHISITKVLLKFKANSNIPNFSGKTIKNVEDEIKKEKAEEKVDVKKRNVNIKLGKITRKSKRTRTRRNTRTSRAVVLAPDIPHEDQLTFPPLPMDEDQRRRFKNKFMAMLSLQEVNPT